jgi:hypothetical protein
VAFWMMAGGAGNLGSPQWSFRSGDGSGNGILYIMGASLPRAWRAIRLAAPLDEETGKAAEGSHISSSTLPQFTEFIVLRYRASVQNCSAAKYISKHLRDELAGPPL